MQFHKFVLGSGGKKSEVGLVGSVVHDGMDAVRPDRIQLSVAGSPGGLQNALTGLGQGVEENGVVSEVVAVVHGSGK